MVAKIIRSIINRPLLFVLRFCNGILKFLLLHQPGSVS